MNLGAVRAELESAIILGGISKVNLKKLNLINCSGFAGISFFE